MVPFFLEEKTRNLFALKILKMFLFPSLLIRHQSRDKCNGETLLQSSQWVESSVHKDKRKLKFFLNPKYHNNSTTTLFATFKEELSLYVWMSKVLDTFSTTLYIWMENQMPFKNHKNKKWISEISSLMKSSKEK